MMFTRDTMTAPGTTTLGGLCLGDGQDGCPPDPAYDYMTAPYVKSEARNGTEAVYNPYANEADLSGASSDIRWGTIAFFGAVSLGLGYLFARRR
jgi:hypothetical protein